MPSSRESSSTEFAAWMRSPTASAWRASSNEPSGVPEAAPIGLRSLASSSVARASPSNSGRSGHLSFGEALVVAS
jgi:hypothetical protein